MCEEMYTVFKADITTNRSLSQRNIMFSYNNLCLSMSNQQFFFSMNCIMNYMDKMGLIGWLIVGWYIVF